jgi:cephalosporin hydroxylase
MDDFKQFEETRAKNVRDLGTDEALKLIARQFLIQSSRHGYSYNFDWLGLPIIQFPQDILAMQEIIWKVKPDLIIETGIARGGSIIFYASLLEMLGGKGKVVGIDIDIRPHNKKKIKSHPLYAKKKRIVLIEGSSTDEKIIEQVKKLAKGKKRILVAFDSNHTYAHVRDELKAYAPLVTKGSYVVVFDTVIESLPEDLLLNRPWRKGNNPKNAVDQFLKHNFNFVIDKDIEDKLLITVSPSGYLKRIN